MLSRSLAVAVAAVLAVAVLLLFVSACGPGPKTTDKASVTSPESSTGAASDIVHTTKTGKRYHRAGCSSLSRSDIPMTREEAEAKGLTPCKLCRP